MSLLLALQTLALTARRAPTQYTCPPAALALAVDLEGISLQSGKHRVLVTALRGLMSKTPAFVSLVLLRIISVHLEALAASLALQVYMASTVPTRHLLTQNAALVSKASTKLRKLSFPVCNVPRASTLLSMAKRNAFRAAQRNCVLKVKSTLAGLDNQSGPPLALVNLASQEHS